MPSFLVAFWSGVFERLGQLSLFSLVRKFFPFAKSPGFVDAWVLGHLILAMACVFLVVNCSWAALGWGVLFYGLLRTFEIVVYQTNVLLFDASRSIQKGNTYELEGYRRLVLLLLHNYVEIIFWLACTYTVLAADYDHKWSTGSGTVLGGIYSSFITMTTFGEFDLMPKTDWAAALLLGHACIGLFMTLLSLARFVSLLPVPASKDPTEQGGR